MENLWGDFSDIETIRTPQKILNEQASYLNSNTQNKILASLIKSESSNTRFSFKFDFILTSPSIKGYKYRMFTISHDVPIYPLYIKIEESIMEEIEEKLINILKDDLSDELDQVEPYDYCEYSTLNEETFINVLKLILSSAAVKRVITALSSLSDTI